MFVAFYKGPAKGFAKQAGHALIKWWTGSEYSHCELVFDYDPSGDSVCASASFRDGGVRFKDIDLQSGHWDLLNVHLAYGAETAARKWFDEHAGAKYDLFGLLFFVLPFKTENRKRWFCSEACAEALGIYKSWTYTPESLFQYLVNKGSPQYATR